MKGTAMRRRTTHPESRHGETEREDERKADAVTQRRAAALKHAREVLQGIRGAEVDRAAPRDRASSARRARQRSDPR
jgi:hypothetical protein